MAKPRRIRPPRMAEWLFRRTFPDGGFDTMVCDLEESFQEIVRERNFFFGKVWYWSQVLAALYLFVCLHIRGGLSMFMHHLKITLRNLRRHKGNSFINIFGLAVSFTVVIFIALFIQNESSFDKGNEHIDRMYTVIMGGEGGQQHIISAAALELSENVPEIVKYTRLSLRSDYVLQYHDAVFEQVFFYAAGFSILIACLGLLGLASSVAAKRTKEIGIRKVLGASISQILILLSGEFTAAILLANLIAWPAAYYLMNKWLANFAYRIDLGISMFVLSALMAFGVALISVGWQSLKAATTDPVNSLRYE